MAKTTKAAKVTRKERKGKVVSFAITGEGKSRQFTAVNKYAQGIAAVTGGKVAPKHLKALKKLGFRVLDTEQKAIAL
jgi:hypothetical protein